MSQSQLESRVAALESEVANLKSRLGIKEKPWWEEIVGTFANDPFFEEAMKLGREYRESTKPKPRRKKKKRKPNDNS